MGVEILVYYLHCANTHSTKVAVGVIRGFHPTSQSEASVYLFCILGNAFPTTEGSNLPYNPRSKSGQVPYESAFIFGDKQSWVGSAILTEFRLVTDIYRVVQKVAHFSSTSIYICV